MFNVPNDSVFNHVNKAYSLNTGFALDKEKHIQDDHNLIQKIKWKVMIDANFFFKIKHLTLQTDNKITIICNLY